MVAWISCLNKHRFWSGCSTDFGLEWDRVAPKVTDNALADKNSTIRGIGKNINIFGFKKSGGIELADSSEFCD